MAKKIQKRRIKRSSSIERTVQEGKNFVTQSNRVIRKRKRENEQRQKQIQRRVTAQISNRPVKAKGARRVKKTAKLPVRPAVPSRPAVQPAIRTGSRASQAVRTGSRAGNTGAATGMVIEQELHDRLNRHGANIGKLNFSLRWWDPNDLDLHVECPCGTHIYFGNKKCGTCGGELDIDMNVGGNMSLEPVEHIFFKNATPGLYKFYVRYFSGPKEYGGVRGGEKSKYALSLHEDLNQIFKYEDTVTSQNRQLHYDYAV